MAAPRSGICLEEEQRVSAGGSRQRRNPSSATSSNLTCSRRVLRAGLDSGLRDSQRLQSYGAEILGNHRPRRAMERLEGNLYTFYMSGR